MAGATTPRRAWAGIVAALVSAGCGTPARNDPFSRSEPDAGGPRDAAVAVDSGPPGQCTASAQCDDGFACTDDQCVIGGRCEHTALNSRCADGQRCAEGRGCVSGAVCATNADCNDNVACTRDLCGADHACQNINNDSLCTSPGQVCISTGCAAAGTCAVDRDCDDRAFCNGVERCGGGRCAAGAPQSCADADPCTGDVCNEAMQRCDHPPLNPCGGGTVTAGSYAVTPAIQYSCGAGSIGPVTTVALGVTAAGVTVTGVSPTLTLAGRAPADGMFSATGSEQRGPCTWVHTVSGSFTMPTRFTGSWNISFDNCLASFNCLGGFGLITGTRM